MYLVCSVWDPEKSTVQKPCLQANMHSLNVCRDIASQPSFVGTGFASSESLSSTHTHIVVFEQCYTFKPK